MPTSQFKIYSSNDIQGPGRISGGTGSLITILDYCLVDGYGTGSFVKAPAGWTKPFANSGSTATTPAFGCWRQGGGSSMSLFMNDCGGASAAGGREAMITGWESITSIAPTGTGSNNVGQGYGQFPLPAQELTLGYDVVRKADNTDNTGTGSRDWVIAADATTMYMWIWAEAVADPARTYHWMFGDIYSYAGANDVWKCSIYGRNVLNTAVGAVDNSTARDFTELITGGPWIASIGNYTTVAQIGHYLARSGHGAGQSLNYCKKGDAQWQNAQSIYLSGTAYWQVMYGNMQSNNGADNMGYLVPLEVVEPGTFIRIRGRLRGLYHPPFHYLTYSNGQVLSGSGDFAGRTFMNIRYGYNGGSWFLETSPTVDTN